MLDPKIFGPSVCHTAASGAVVLTATFAAVCNVTADFDFTGALARHPTALARVLIGSHNS